MAFLQCFFKLKLRTRFFIFCINISNSGSTFQMKVRKTTKIDFIVIRLSI